MKNGTRITLIWRISTDNTFAILGGQSAQKYLFVFNTVKFRIFCKFDGRYNYLYHLWLM